MTTDAVELDELRIGAYSGQAFRKFLLLMWRKQNVGLDANYQCTLQVQSFESGLQRSAVFRKIKEVGRTR